MTSTPKNGTVMSRPLTLASAFGIAGGMAAIMTVFVLVGAPYVRNVISDYANGRGFVTREELRTLVLERLSDLATKDQVTAITERLDRMDARLRELEKR